LAKKVRSRARISSRRGPKPRPTLLHEKKAFRRGHRIVAGVDESGRGPLAGPVVAAAVILNKYKFKSKIDDCKRLSPKNRLRAYGEILENSIYSVAVIDKDVIDSINIYNAARLVMEKAVMGLGVKPDYVLVDGRIKLSIPYKGRSITAGDRHSLSIACASIVAKVRRDRIMEGLHRRYPKYGFINHKGYGTARHMKMLKKYGPTPTHRRSFEPVKTLIRDRKVWLRTR
jgi:ribonuclease HII